MKNTLFVACAMTLLTIGPTKAQFSGKFELGPPGCEDKGLCTLTYDLRFKDPQGLEWLAAAKDTTDGASIPPWAQPFIGKPFDKSFIKAAVIHDHYCGRHVRPWPQTHHVFYDGLIDQEVDIGKAKLMYYAVYLGGPKWLELIPGKNCGHNCTFKVDIGALFPAEIGKNPLMTRVASYNEPGFSDELKAVEKLIKENGDKVDLEFLERRAERLRPNDLFYKYKDKQLTIGGLAIE
jgi:hypothetical protein